MDSHNEIEKRLKKDRDHTMGLNDMTFEDEQPQFHIEDVQLQFELQGGLKTLCVQNNKMCLVMDTSVYRIDLENPSKVSLVTLKATGIRITNAWLHPNGSHLIVRTNSAHYYYLHETYESFKLLTRFKGLNIMSIAFPLCCDKYFSTGDFLLTDNEGEIYASSIEAHNQNQAKKDDKYLRHVYKTSAKVFGLGFTANNLRIVLFAGSKILIFECVEHSYDGINQAFAAEPMVAYANISDGLEGLLELNSKSFICVTSDAQVYSNDEELELSNCRTLITLNDKFAYQTKSFVVTEHHLIFLNEKRDRLLIFNKLSKSKKKIIPLDDVVMPGDSVLGIDADKTFKTVWIYSRRNIYELVINNESMSVWYDYFEIGMYDEALGCLNLKDSRNILKKDMVLLKQGYTYLQKGGFGEHWEATQEDINLQLKGAEALAKLREAFEKVCLKFLNIYDPEACDVPSQVSVTSGRLLLKYLCTKFFIFKDSGESRVRLVILSSWIVQLNLRLIFDLERKVNFERTTRNLDVVMESSYRESSLSRNLLKDLDEHLHDFILKANNILDTKTVFRLLADFGRFDKLVFYAERIQDYGYLLNYYIDKEDWPNGLKIFQRLYFVSNGAEDEVLYRSANSLLRGYPEGTMSISLKFPHFNYEKLLPGILFYNKRANEIEVNDNYSIIFLQRLIFEKGIRNRNINNYYLILLISYPHYHAESKKSLELHITRFFNYVRTEYSVKEKKLLAYDPHLILRACLKFSQYQPAILILMHDMNLYKQALEIALEKGLTELAIFVLNEFDEYLLNDKSENEENLAIRKGGNFGKVTTYSHVLFDETFSERKTLWMMFAKYLIDGVCKGKAFELLEDDSAIESPICSSRDSSQQHTSVHPQKDNVTRGLNDVQSENVPIKDFNEKVVGKFNTKYLSKALNYLLIQSNRHYSSSSILTLKSLLPLLPESITINNFKDEVVYSLHQYNSKISQLSLEMEESLKLTHDLKRKVKESKSNDNGALIFTIIEAGEPCVLCGSLLTTRNFICFPNCHHNYHKDCLVKYYLSEKKDYRFQVLFHNYKKSPTLFDKQELENIITRECCTCNNTFIDNLDGNLLSERAECNDIKDWSL